MLSNAMSALEKMDDLVLDRMAQKKLKFFLRLNYPTQIVAVEDGFRGSYPDLPGCEAKEDDVGRLYVRLDRMRTTWLTAHILAGQIPPLPNTAHDSPLDNH